MLMVMAIILRSKKLSLKLVKRTVAAQKVHVFGLRGAGKMVLRKLYFKCPCWISTAVVLPL